MVEIKAALKKSLEALEAEQKARSKVDLEVLALWGRVLETEESSARLHEQVTQQEEGLSLLKNIHIGKYLFCF